MYASLSSTSPSRHFEPSAAQKRLTLLAVIASLVAGVPGAIILGVGFLPVESVLLIGP